jgi:hypothetical protein
MISNTSQATSKFYGNQLDDDFANFREKILKNQGKNVFILSQLFYKIGRVSLATKPTLPMDNNSF